MQRQRGELVPIGDAVSGLDDVLVSAIPSASAQTRHSFTVADQVNQLVAASEAEPERGFMARMMVLCSLPRTNPGNRKEYNAANGPYTLVMTAIGDNKLPFGNLPRLILAWLCTEVVRTQSRELVLGKSLSDFMRALGVYSSAGGVHSPPPSTKCGALQRTCRLTYKDEHGEKFVSSAIADRGEFWWNPKRPDESTLWESKIRLGEDFFNEVIRHPVPLDMNTLNALKRLRPGLGSLPLAHLSHLRTHAAATAHLASGIPAVRLAPGKGQRQTHRSKLPP